MVKIVVALAALSLAAPVTAQQVSPILQSDETLLQIAATGTVKAVPDVAELSVAVSSDGATAKQALSADAIVAQRLTATLERMAVPMTGVRTDNLSVRPRYRQDKDGDDTEEVLGYRATNRLKIRLTNVASAAGVFDALAAAGATEVSGPNFSFGDDAPIKARARAEAVRIAQRQAADYAAPFSLKIARVVRISERSTTSSGGDDIVVTGMRLQRTPPLQPGEQEVSATVWVDYAMVSAPR